MEIASEQPRAVRTLNLVWSNVNVRVAEPGPRGSTIIQAGRTYGFALASVRRNHKSSSSG
jgi:hypothetical protein